MSTTTNSIGSGTAAAARTDRRERLSAAARRKSPPQLRLACADFSFPLLAHQDALELIQHLGFQGVDIGLFPERSHFRPDEYLSHPERGAQKLSELVRGQGLDFADIFLQAGPGLQERAENHPDPQQRQQSRDVFLRTLELVVHCRARHMTSLPGIFWPGETAEDSFERCAHELAWRAEQAAAQGVVYSVEPHMWSVVPTPEAALRLVAAAPGLTLTLDYGHFICQGFANERIHPLVERASHFHARSACRGLLQTSLAQNSIDFAGMLHGMRAADYSGWVGIEYVRMEGTAEVPDVDNLSETILLRNLLDEQWESPS